MDAVASLLKLSHVVLAMFLVAGIIGRWLTLRRAQRHDDVELVARFSEMAGIGIIVALMVLKPL